MKTFEEKFTAWIDGTLPAPELADFERELSARPDAESERFAAKRLGGLLREHMGTPRLSNEDFFNHQLMQRIEAEQPREERAPLRTHFWTLPRMAWTGALCMVLAAALYRVTVPKTQKQVASSQQYVASILNAHADDPDVSATAYHDQDENVTVLWLDGLNYIPADRKLK